MPGQVNDQGFLPVGDGHCIYWEDWGNPDGVPVMFLHGGPGQGFNDTHKTLFDPAVHHVLFHDQRGCGASRPFASTQHNTTQDLIGDIDLLMRYLGWESAHLAGGSWGCTLSLLYAIAHPERVRGMLLWGVYLARPFEDNWVCEGTGRFHFPTEWERFIGLVPPPHRTSGAAVMGHYAEQIRSRDPGVARKFAVEWTLWESVLCSIEYDPVRNEDAVTADPNTVAVALLETHYFLNGCFIPENHILDSIGAIRDIPCTVVQGRFDMCTPPVSAYDLARTYGANLSLRLVNAGHLRTDREMRPALRAALSAFTAPLPGDEQAPRKR
jgi:proline iminopeptidase